MKASLLIILLPLLAVEVAARSLNTFSSAELRNQDPDVVTGLEEISNPLPASDDNYYKKRTRSSSSSSSSDEVMQTAETYFRPLSRYRELQERKKNKYHKHTDNEVAAAATVPVTVKPNVVAHDRTLLSIHPEFCMPVKNGMVCFYKV